MNARDSALRLVAGEADGYRLDEQVGYLLRKANQRHLAEIGQASQNQLGQSIAMDAATIKGVIDRLKARGLVELSNHGSDRRRRVVSLTAAGRATVEALLPLGGAVSDETLAPLNPREAATLLKLLARLT